MTSSAYSHLPSYDDDSEATTSRDDVNAKRRASNKPQTIVRGDGHGGRADKKINAGSPPSEDVEDSDDEKGPKKKAKKRRRVIQACSTCRRKKVKCEGLPNASNTCEVSDPFFFQFSS